MGTLLVTGAHGGIGRAVCEAAAADWRVVAVGRPAGDSSPRPLASCVLHVDVTAPEQVRDLFEQMQRDDLNPDAWVHCVGSTSTRSLDQITPGELDDVIRVNLLSSFYVLAAFARSLRQRGAAGSAVLFSSVVARLGIVHHEAIAAAKAGIEGLVRAAAASHAGAGLRVNAIAPGLTETPLTARLLSSEAGRAAAARQYPLPGINAPADIAAAALWLVSPQASRITGQVMPVDGGFTAVRPLVR